MIKLLVLGGVFVLGLIYGQFFVNWQRIGQKEKEIRNLNEEIRNLNEKVLELESQIDSLDGLYRTSTVVFVGLSSAGVAALFVVGLMRWREQVCARVGACNVKK